MMEKEMRMNHWTSKTWTLWRLWQIRFTHAYRWQQTTRQRILVARCPYQTWAFRWQVCLTVWHTIWMLPFSMSQGCLFWDTCQVICTLEGHTDSPRRSLWSLGVYHGKRCAGTWKSFQSGCRFRVMTRCSESRWWHQPWRCLTKW